MQKTLYVDAVGSEVIFARRRGTRHLRLSIRSDGRVRLSVPYGVSLRQAEKFLLEKADWILKHQKPITMLQNGDHIGKSYRLIVQRSPAADSRPRSRLKANEIHITIPHDTDVEETAVQAVMRRAADRALTQEATRLLPQRLQTLAKQTGLDFNTVKIKKLKSRWGSCDNRQNITLNSYLTQLDWPLIDYVLLHELTHTVHQHHQPDFWQHLEQFVPDYKEKRKQLKTQPTDIHPTTY